MKIKNINRYILLLALLGHTKTYNKELKSITVFNSLSKIKQYADTHEEYPDIDNKDWLKPKYNSFYKNNVPTFWQKAFNFITFRKPLWSAKEFKGLLEYVTKERENNAHISRFAKRITPSVHSRFIIWSSLFGAFHSIERCLEYLEKEKIINNNLRILDKKTFFVFNGNSIGLSPYNLETLTVILRLMANNPTQVIYTRGKHEDKEHWLNFNLQDELEIRAKHISTEKTPLKNLLNRFFDTLPLALYITKKENNKNNGVRISYFDRTYRELSEPTFPELFKDENNEKIKICTLRKTKQANTSNVDIQAIIKSSETLKRFFARKGLAQVDPDKGATAFVIFSSPTKSHRIEYNFFYDSFSVIKIKEKFDKWTLTLFNQDVREPLGIEKVATFNLTSGDLIKQESEAEKRLKQKVKILEKKLKQKTPTTKPPQEKSLEKPEETITQEVKMGTTLGTTGELAHLGRSIKNVLNTTIEHANKKGINGKTLQITILEDESQPSKAKKNIKTLKNEGIDIIFSSLGGATTLSYLDMIKKGSIAMLFPNTAYSVLRDPTLKHIVNFGPGYSDVEKFAFSYAQKNIKAEKFAFFYQKKLAGLAIPDIVKNLDKKSYVVIPYDPATLRLKNQATKIKAVKPDILFIFSSPSSAIKIIKEIEPVNLRKTTIIGYRLGSNKFKKFLQENNIYNKYIGIENLPNPQTSKIKLLQEFVNNNNNNNKENIDIYSAETYVVTQILIDILKKIKTKVTKENIVKELEKIKNYDLKGLNLNFDSQTRQLSNYVWLSKGKQKPKKYNLAKPQPSPRLQQAPRLSADGEKDIIIGTTLDLEGRRQREGRLIKNAITRYFKEINKTGGIHGRKIRLIAKNDSYKKEKAKKNIQELIKKGVDIILLPLGGKTIRSYLNLIKKGNVLALFPITGSSNLRNPKLTDVINFGPSYYDIDKASIEYVIKNKDSKRFAFFFEESQHTKQSALSAIKANNLKKENYILIPYKKDTTNFKEQIKKVKKFKPDTIALWCLEYAAKGFIKEMGAHNLINTTLITVKLADEQFREFLKENGILERLVNIENIPNPKTSKLEIITLSKEITKKDDPLSTESFIGTYILVDTLKKIKQNITKEKIINILEKIKNYDLKGLMLDFHPQTRQIFRNLWVDDGGSKEWVKVELK